MVYLVRPRQRSHAKRGDHEGGSDGYIVEQVRDMLKHGGGLANPESDEPHGARVLAEVLQENLLWDCRNKIHDINPSRITSSVSSFSSFLQACSVTNSIPSFAHFW